MQLLIIITIKWMYTGEKQVYNGNDSRAMLDHYQVLHRQLDGDIYNTNAEIGVLNNKITK